MVSFPAPGSSESTSFRRRGISQKKRKKDGRGRETPGRQVDSSLHVR